MTGPVRVAVVGTGFISSRKHLPALVRLRPRAEVVALVDANIDAASETARRFSVPSVYAGVGEMIERARPDVVVICTPPRTHAPLALEAIARGCNVLIEKPMAVSVEECDEIIAVARDRGVLVTVAHTDLFYPPFIRARRMVSDGRIGRFTGMRIFLSTPTDYMTSLPDHWAHQLPGGVIGESGPHTVYMTLAFINPILEVRAHGLRHLPYEWSRFDDYRIELGGDEGTCSITSIYTSAQWAAEVELWGTDGILRLDLETMALVEHHRPRLEPGVVARSALEQTLAVWRHTLSTSARVLTRRYRNTHDILLERFVASVSRGAPVPVTPEAGREAVRVMGLIAERLDDRQADGPRSTGPALEPEDF